MKKIKILLLITSISYLIISCSHYDDLEKNGKVSTANDKSHNSGKDCMSCHANASNKASFYAWWNVAGTVYNGSNVLNPNARIELWTQPNAQGNKILSLVTDKDANFYTEKIINFKGGCYPVAISGNDTTYMRSVYNGGGCSGCHGQAGTAVAANIFVN